CPPAAAVPVQDEGVSPVVTGGPDVVVGERSNRGELRPGRVEEDSPAAGGSVRTTPSRDAHRRCEGHAGDRHGEQSPHGDDYAELPNFQGVSGGTMSSDRASMVLFLLSTKPGPGGTKWRP